MITAMSTSAVRGALNFDELRSLTSAATTASLPAHRVATVADTVQIGDGGRVCVVGIDPERRRLFLSIRQADVPK
jgi:hypothetical protein